LRTALWGPKLDIVPMTDGPVASEDVPRPGCEFDVFLDLLGYLSTTSAAFFLDDSYVGLTVDERDPRVSLRGSRCVDRNVERGQVA